MAIASQDHPIQSPRHMRRSQAPQTLNPVEEGSVARTTPVVKSISFCQALHLMGLYPGAFLMRAGCILFETELLWDPQSKDSHNSETLGYLL